MASNLAPNDTNGRSEVFVHDLATGSTEVVSVASDGGLGNGAATAFSISSDGRFVTFLSTANNLVAGDSNAAPDVFVRDRKNGTTERVSLTAAGAEGPGAGLLLGTEISADGRFVLFSGRDGYVPSDTNGFVDLFVRARVAGPTVRVLHVMP